MGIDIMFICYCMLAVVGFTIGFMAKELENQRKEKWRI